MNLSELRTECRALMGDNVTPYAISDDELNIRLNEAEKEACTRANLITDSKTRETCRINVKTGKNNYNLSNLVIDVLRVYLTSSTTQLDKLGYKALDEDTPNWITNHGVPTGYTTDYSVGEIYLSHVPVLDDIMTLTVSRLPLSTMSEDTDEPEINCKYHYDLIYWAAHLCFSTVDFDLFDLTASERYKEKFTNRFGQRKTAEHLEHRLKKYRRRGKAQYI